MASPFRRAWWLLSGALLFGAPGVAAGAQDPGVAFVDDRPLALTLEPSGALAQPPVSVCNVSGVTAHAPVAAMSTFQKGTDPPETLVAVVPSTDSSDWNAGECRDVVLVLVSGAKVSAGAHTGV